MFSSIFRVTSFIGVPTLFPNFSSPNSFHVGIYLTVFPASPLIHERRIKFSAAVDVRSSQYAILHPLLRRGFLWFSEFSYVHHFSEASLLNELTDRVLNEDCNDDLVNSLGTLLEGAKTPKHFAAFEKVQT